MLSSFSRYNSLLYQYNMRRKCPLSHLRWPSGPTSIKTRDPIWGYFCISDHKLILIIYGDTQGQCRATSPNYRFNMLYWYNKKELNTRVTLAFRGNSASNDIHQETSRPRSAVSRRQPMSQHL